MSEPGVKRAAGQAPPKPPRGCHIFLISILVIIVLIVVFGLKNIFHKSHDKAAQPEQKKIVFWTLGGSETHGYGAAVSFSWPMQLAPFFEKKYPNTKLSVINSTIPDANTSEGLEIVQTFLKKFHESNTEGEDRHSATKKPDFALICFGINNRWNLQSGTFATWPSEELTDEQFRAVIKTMGVDSPGALTRIPRKQYFKHWDEEGWDTFFDSYSNPFLIQWISRDLSAMIELMRSNQIEPILLTYYYDRFPKLNELIKEIGIQTNTTVLDLQTPMEYFVENHMILYQKEDDPLDFQINSDGYHFIAKQVINQFTKHYPQDRIAR